MNDDVRYKIEFLEKVFGNVNNWLHFAEAKNAALVVFNIAALDAFKSFDICEDKNLFWNMILILFVISTLCALISFTPVLSHIKVNLEKAESHNLLFYKNIASFSNVDDYITELEKRYWDMHQGKECQVSYIERDLCEEIYENSKITVRKYKAFTMSLVFSVMAFTVGLFFIA